MIQAGRSQGDASRSQTDARSRKSRSGKRYANPTNQPTKISFFLAFWPRDSVVVFDHNYIYTVYIHPPVHIVKLSTHTNHQPCNPPRRSIDSSNQTTDSPPTLPISLPSWSCCCYSLTGLRSLSPSDMASGSGSGSLLRRTAPPGSEPRRSAQAHHHHYYRTRAAAEIAAVS